MKSEQSILQKAEITSNKSENIIEKSEINTFKQTQITHQTAAVSENNHITSATKVEEKHAKLSRSTAIVSGDEQPIATIVTANTEEIKQQFISLKEEVKETVLANTPDTINKPLIPATIGEKKKPLESSKDITSENKIVEKLQEPTKQEQQIKVVDALDRSNDLKDNKKTDEITSESVLIDNNNKEQEQVVQTGIKVIVNANNNQVLQQKQLIYTKNYNINNSDHQKAPQDTGEQTNNNKENSSSNTQKSSDTHLSQSQSQQQYQTVSVFNFGDRDGNGSRGGDGGGGGGPPLRSNLPDFLVPPHLITYETSFEINIRKIPPPVPPAPPKFIKKLLVHTESLERKTRAFLTGNYELGTTDSSIRTARQKIRSLKSTILNTDDEVKHAEDTIQKAKSGDFLHIYNPHLGPDKPLYEFIEIPERSDEECSEISDRRSERGTSEQAQQDMSEYYSSRYSSRSSRKERKVEGNNFIIMLNILITREFNYLIIIIIIYCNLNCV